MHLAVRRFSKRIETKVGSKKWGQKTDVFLLFVICVVQRASVESDMVLPSFVL